MYVWNVSTARITWTPLAGSAPSKRFVGIAKPVSALIDLMPPSGSAPLKPFMPMLNVRIARITWRPLAGSAPSK
eukprot:755011-Amphidinium_carterae.1